LTSDEDTAKKVGLFIENFEPIRSERRRIVFDIQSFVEATILRYNVEIGSIGQVNKETRRLRG
jgi:hypothetical protein